MAKFKMGCLLLDGEGVEKDEKKGFEYLEELASQDFPSAVFECARCYFQGTGVEADNDKSQALLLKAANLRFPAAEYIWARSYWDLYHEKALAFMRDAAGQSYPQAIEYLNNCL